MAGTAESGWAAGSATLFRGAAWVVAADDGLDLDVWRDVAELAWACGAHVVPAAAAEHDDAVARVSHLPHLLAAILAAVGRRQRPRAGAGRRLVPDGTRVAGTRPELVLAMCEGNRAALLTAVDDALGRFGAMRGSLASTGGLAALCGAGHEAVRRWSRIQHGPRVKVHLDGPDALARLREIGSRGERVIGWQPPEPSGRPPG